MKIQALSKVLLTASVMGLLAATGANAQDPAEPCTCKAKAKAIGAIGSIETVSGTVYATDANGFGSAEPKQSLVVGSEIIVGAESSVSIKVGGTCALDIGSFNDVEISYTAGQNVCVRVASSVAETTMEAVVDAPTQGQPVPEVSPDELPEGAIVVGGVVLVGGVVVGIIALAGGFDSNGDRPASP